MNHVWSTIAVNAPRVRRQAGPLLELFHGYAKCRNISRNAAPLVVRQDVQLGTKHSQPFRTTTRVFSASALLSATAKSPRPPPPPHGNHISGLGQRRVDASKLEPAQTVASHTEGLASVAEEEEGVTWRDYDPEGGMPLPNGDLSQTDIKSVFGNEDVDVENGNYILNVMHWRRMSGALVDSGLDSPRRSGVTREEALQALQYTWAEEETLRLQEEIQQRAISVGIYKRDPEYDEEIQMDQGTPEGRQRTGESVLQTHRMEREAEWEQEQAEAKVKQEREETAALHSVRGPLELSGGVQPSVASTHTGYGGIVIGSGPQSAWLAPIERKPWVKYYEDQANLLKDNILPNLSAFDRLAPSFVVALATAALCLYLSQNYTPPPKSARVWPDTPPAVATLTTITAVLTLAFVASRVPPLWRFFNTYCTIVPALPHSVSILGYMIRHGTIPHLVVNTAALWAFGLTLHEDVGRGTFLAIFMVSGAFGGFTSLASQVWKKQWAAYAYGVSAAALGVVAATCTLRPQGTLQVGTWELPFAAWVLVVLLAGTDVLAAARGLRTGIDHWGHIGGLATGLAGGLYVRWQTRGGEGVMTFKPAAGTKATEEGEVVRTG
ncbi:hypothetical protein LTR91_025602 [Friedmanniomyces endolithicus]|uniref:Peptidase S54 rhomboid domain-containing protein n=1 Tax=Friedmanniomyces endolithicus TaxID=329885 RepID=A0AAN6H208_9PEZI|nr:hypothetical protein LTR57_022905 [Friedmanniomyces endolithicus]KAK0950523.1 hypothetical protein LTR91_025602 [Friedmanniomyces endolithicus]KAK0956765.1 hypothetical protein LTS01_022689 [Friedmanniomyces endolithicus]KAK1036378.1 hypothetical protein LTS16_013807 [Friedmanniomyces endolithicus]